MSTMYAPLMCHRMPRGWWCSRPPGHNGPCAGSRWWQGWRERRFIKRHRRAQLMNFKDYEEDIGT